MNGEIFQDNLSSDEHLFHHYVNTYLSALSYHSLLKSYEGTPYDIKEMLPIVKDIITAISKYCSDKSKKSKLRTLSKYIVAKIESGQDYTSEIDAIQLVMAET